MKLKIIRLRRVRRKAGKIKITFPCGPLFVEKVRVIEGWNWHPERKCIDFLNLVSILKKFLAIFSKKRIYIDPVLKASTYSKLCGVFFVPHSKAETITSVEKKLRMRRGYNEKTRKVYLRHINRHLRYFSNVSEELNENRIRERLFYSLKKGGSYYASCT